MITPVRLFTSSRFGANEVSADAQSQLTSTVMLPSAQPAPAASMATYASAAQPAAQAQPAPFLTQMQTPAPFPTQMQTTASAAAAPITPLLDPQQIAAKPVARTAVNQRAAEFLTGGASVVFSFMASLWWTIARGMNLGKTAVNAVSWLANLSWAATAIEAVSLGWGIYASYKGNFAAHGIESVLFNVGFALTTVLAAGVLKSVSLVAVYQLGEGNPTLNCATVTTWFAFLWMFAWRSLHAWNDSFLLRMTREAPTPIPMLPAMGGTEQIIQTKGFRSEGMTRRWRM